MDDRQRQRGFLLVPTQVRGFGDVTYLVIAGVGLALFVFAFIFDDALDGVLPETDWISLPALAAAMVALGAGSFIIESQTDAPSGVAIGVGAVLAVGSGWGGS